MYKFIHYSLSYLVQTFLCNICSSGMRTWAFSLKHILGSPVSVFIQARGKGLSEGRGEEKSMDITMCWFSFVSVVIRENSHFEEQLLFFLFFFIIVFKSQLQLIITLSLKVVMVKKQQQYYEVFFSQLQVVYLLTEGWKTKQKNSGILSIVLINEH